MANIPRLIVICATAATLLVQSVCTGWMAECCCRISNDPTCQTTGSSCCCPADPGDSGKDCRNCQGSAVGQHPPVAAPGACHCRDSSPVPATPQTIPESSGSDRQSLMAGTATCCTAGRRLRVALAHPPGPSNKAWTPHFKQVACCVWLI